MYIFISTEKMIIALNVLNFFSNFRYIYPVYIGICSANVCVTTIYLVIHCRVRFYNPGENYYFIQGLLSKACWEIIINMKNWVITFPLCKTRQEISLSLSSLSPPSERYLWIIYTLLFVSPIYSSFVIVLHFTSTFTQSVNCVTISLHPWYYHPLSQTYQKMKNCFKIHNMC